MAGLTVAAPGARGGAAGDRWRGHSGTGKLNAYPDTARRFLYLGIVVLATVVLYYQLYVAGAVAPQILSQFHMSFRFYVNITVVGNTIGAFTSVLAGSRRPVGPGEHGRLRPRYHALLILLRHPARQQRLDVRDHRLGRRLRRGDHPRRDAGARARLLAAAGASLGDGVLDPGARRRGT